LTGPSDGRAYLGALHEVWRPKSRVGKPLHSPPHEGCPRWTNHYSDGEFWKVCMCGTGIDWPRWPDREKPHVCPTCARPFREQGS
jgi:hypothetical protein